MDSTKFLKIIVTILVVLNLGTLTFIWMHHHRGMPGPPHQHGGDTGRFLVHELNLNEGQQKQFDLLKKEHHEQVEGLREHGKEMHEHFFDLLQNPAPDAALVQQSADSIASIQKQIELATFYHFQKVRAICKPDQQKRFDDVIDEALRMLDPKPQGPPPRH